VIAGSVVAKTVHTVAPVPPVAGGQVQLEAAAQAPLLQSAALVHASPTVAAAVVWM
jgi:hypothetical protein